LKRRMTNVPQWMRQRQLEPAPGAFRQFVEAIPPVTCCPVHREAHCRLLAAVRAPAGLCLLCGTLGTWRARWPAIDTPAPMPTPCRARATEVDLGVYYDLCGRCRQLPDTPAQVDILLRQRDRAPWN
jgi:hypothetical protein